MRERRHAGGDAERRVEARIDGGNDVRNRVTASGNRFEDGALPKQAVLPQGPDIGGRIGDDAAMARQEAPLRPREEHVQGIHVVAHRAVGRRHDRGRPSHDVIAGEEEIGAAKPEGEMVCGMAGRGDGLEPEAPGLHDAAVHENCVGREGGVASGLHARRLALVERARRAVWPGGDDRRAGQRLERPGGERVVAMRVGDEDAGDAGATDCGAKRVEMRRVVGAGVNDDEVPVADQIGVRSTKSEGSGIRRSDAADARNDLHGIAVTGVEIAVEDQRHGARDPFLSAAERLSIRVPAHTKGKGISMRAVSADRTLADTLIPDDGAQRLAVQIGLAVVGSLILWASAKINVPFWPVKMSMQTFVVMALAAAYGPRLGVATVLLYLAEGAFGLPVFQGTPDRGLGLAYMAGPTGGYLLGFVAATFAIGTLMERSKPGDLPRLFGIMLLGDAIIFALGFAWLAWFAAILGGGPGIGAAAAFGGGVAPFVLGDIVKVALATCVVAAASRLVRR